jgi:P27 family predicted phage terminase small subunit
MGRRLIDRRLICKDDIPLFEILCQTYGEIIELETELVTHGRVVQNSTGTPIPNPAQRLLQSARKDFRNISIEFGLSPKSRHTVEPASDSADEDDFS